jgi:UDP-GlcNAc3NAcA epimerase
MIPIAVNLRKSDMKLMLVVGARPQIIKSAPIIREAQSRAEIELQLVHTGQHYDYEMSKIFFNEMLLPDPMINLGVGSGTHAWQTGNMMIKLEKVMIDHKPDMVMVPGDTNSTLAGALAASKLHLPVAHVEAGARSYDMRMPEEVNRRLTDHCSSLLFAPTSGCAKNLHRENIPKRSVFVSGDTMYDSLLQHLALANKSTILEKLNLTTDKYAVMTLHRPENVDTENLNCLMTALLRLEGIVVAFPVHPRTRKRLETSMLSSKLESAGSVKLIEPVGYHEMLQLVKHAKLVLTDSGGLQKEAFWLHTPCATLRGITEWTETVDAGANILVGSNPRKIVSAVKEIMEAKNSKSRLKRLRNPFGDGQASKKIVAEILERR